MHAPSFSSMALLGWSLIPGIALAASPGADTGARPGHVPGVGDSLPRSNCPAVIGNDATTQEYLQSARASLVAGSSCQAQQSLAMAETRELTRSVVATQAGVPDDSHLVSRIQDASRALSAGDHTQALRLVDLALSN